MRHVLRFTRHNDVENPQRLEDAKKHILFRTDIAMVNAPNGKQYLAYPTKDGRWYCDEGLKPFLTPEDVAWLDNEAKLVAEKWKDYPELWKFLS